VCTIGREKRKEGKRAVEIGAGDRRRRIYLKGGGFIYNQQVTEGR